MTDSGRSRWWMRDVSRDLPIFRWSPNEHRLTVAEAVDSLCALVGDGLRRMSQTLSEIRAEYARRDHARALRAELEADVLGILVAGRRDEAGDVATASAVVDYFQARRAAGSL